MNLRGHGRVEKILLLQDVRFNENRPLLSFWDDPGDNTAPERPLVQCRSRPPVRAVSLLLPKLPPPLSPLALYVCCPAYEAE